MKHDKVEKDFLYRKIDIQESYEKGVYNHDRWEREMREALLWYGAVHPHKAKKEAEIMGVDINWEINPYKQK